MIPQLIWIAFALVGFGVTVAKHGEIKTGKHDAWISLIALFIAGYILYSGGFFNPLLNR